VKKYIIIIIIIIIIHHFFVVYLQLHIQNKTCSRGCKFAANVCKKYSICDMLFLMTYYFVLFH